MDVSLQKQAERMKLLDCKTILLLGTGRSGTTWLAGILASPFRYRLLFEPFQPHQVPGAECVADRYIDPRHIPKQVAQFCKRALNDEIDCDWVAQSSNRRFRIHRWRFWPKIRIVKAIRANLMVPTIRALFGPNLPILLLARHPGAVVESFQRVKFPWAHDISILLGQDGLQDAFGIPLAQLRDYAVTDVGRLAVRWAIENVYLLKFSNRFSIHVVYYEKLLSDPVQQIKILCDKLNIQSSKRLDVLVNQPSYTTHPRSPLYQTGGSVTGWRQRLSSKEATLIEDILKVVEYNYPFSSR